MKTKTVSLAWGMVLSFGFAATASGAESLEQLIDRAMQNQPHVVAAHAKVTLAQAEWNVARMEVAREIIALHGEREALSREVARLKQLHKTGAKLVPIGELIAASSKLAQVQTQLRHFVGHPKANTAPRIPGSTASGSMNTANMPANADKLAKALNSPVKLQFRDASINDVVQFLHEMTGVKFNADWSTKDVPVTVSLTDVPVGAGLQAIEDACGNKIRFVVREYGILVAPATRPGDRNVLFAVDFWRHITKTSKIKAELDKLNGAVESLKSSSDELKESRQDKEPAVEGRPVDEDDKPMKRGAPQELKSLRRLLDDLKQNN